MKVGEAASRVVMQVYHTGQGQDERARPRPGPLLRGLDSAWSVSSNPHRESGTRWRAAADVGAKGQQAWLTLGRRETTGTAWATPLGHSLSALTSQLAVLTNLGGGPEANGVLTQAACPAWAS
jgi:hypothetical protein